MSTKVIEASALTSQRWELAELLARTEKEPEKALERVFANAIKSYETSKSISIEPVLREKVWDSLDKSHIADLRKVLLTQVCLKILTAFSPEAIDEMLRELREKDLISTAPFGARLQKVYDLAGPWVVESIEQTADCMTPTLTSEIARELDRDTFSPPLRPV